MKLYGSKSGRHTLQETASSAVATIEKPAPKAAREQKDPGPCRAPKKRMRFLTGYLIYLVLFLLLIAAGLNLLWVRMDAYERSRPYRAMDALMDVTGAEGWRAKLSDLGVEEGFIDTLQLEEANYVKRLGEYSDEKPVYNICFGKKTMLIAVLKEGSPLRFGLNEWELDSLKPVDSGLTVFVPEDAVITVRGERIGSECLVQRDAQSVTLCPLEATREDLPGLSKYVLNQCFSVEYITVTDAEGSELTLAHQTGNAYYYPPLTSGYVIHAPSLVTVTVNGIELTEDNAEITRQPLEDFAGLEDSIPVLPEDLTYVIDGLIARPRVKAVFSDGKELAVQEETEDRWTFRLVTDEEFAASQEEYILEVFDAYIAFLGNRGGDLDQNYRRYLAYLVPGSDPADRAQQSLISLYWIKGRDKALDGVNIREVLRYSDDCFTAWLDYTRRIDENTEDNSSSLFIFVRYNAQWRVIRILNKTSFIRHI